jgi:alkylhydroperoxidase/carboxymuconolactone decarboxylase family protein YurZ
LDESVCASASGGANIRPVKSKPVQHNIAAPPARFRAFRRKHPRLTQAYEALGEAAAEAGPLDPGVRALVRLALAVGAGMEGAVHSHTRRALAAGCTPDEICHVVLLATTTLGFPSMMAALTWAEDVLGRK